MVVREMKLGDGTIHYHGESSEYWAAKSSRLPRGRAVITIALTVIGLLFLAYGVSPLNPTPVTGTIRQVVASNAPAGTSTALVSYAKAGVTKTAKVRLGFGAVTGTSVGLLVHHDGSVTLDEPGTTNAVWIVGIALLVVAAGRAAWAYFRRGTRVRFA